MAKIERLALLKEMHARKLLSDQAELERELSWQEKGMQGEETMEELLVEHLPQEVTIRHDVTLGFGGLTQCDFIVLTANFWLLVEVKNYNGLMTYHDQRCRLRGEDLRADQMAAMRNRLRIVKNLAHSVDPKLAVEAAMVFIHPNGEVEWDSQEDFAILTRNQIHRYLTNLGHRYIIRKSPAHHQQSIDHYLSHYPQELPIITPADWTRMRKGCRCPECGSYELKVSYKTMECQKCGKRTSKSQMVYYLYQQASLLLHNQEQALTRRKLLELADGQISDYTFFNVMSVYKSSNSRGPATYYRNYYSLD